MIKMASKNCRATFTGFLLLSNPLHHNASTRTQALQAKMGVRKGLRSSVDEIENAQAAQQTPQLCVCIQQQADEDRRQMVQVASRAIYKNPMITRRTL